MNNVRRGLIIDSVINAIISTLSIDENNNDDGYIEYESTIDSANLINVLNSDDEKLILMSLKKTGYFSAYTDEEILNVVCDIQDYDNLLLEAGYKALI